MKKRFTACIALALSLVLAIGLIPTSAFAVDDGYIGDGGGNSGGTTGGGLGCKNTI